jgi:two-component system NtrC family sensor kinase
MAGETILIIEDRRENIVHLANNVLRPNGYQVITAMDGQRGLQRATSEDPDLIIMDLKMPKMDGLEVLAALRERQMDIPVILTTFYGSEQVAEQALRLGAAAYVIKPFSVSEMLEAVETALAQRSPSPRPTVQDRKPAEAMPLTRQVERWMRDMDILTRIGKALVAQLDLNKVCSRAVEATIYVTRADHAFVVLSRQDEESSLCLCATRGPRDRHVRLLSQPIEDGLAMQVARTGETALQPKADKDTGLAHVAGGPLGPAAAVPLRYQRETVGVLIAARSPGEPAFGEADEEWLAGLADYVAIAVRNARTFEQREAQAEAPEPNADAVAAWHKELDELVTVLRSAAETADRLADKLSPGDGAASEPG